MKTNRKSTAIIIACLGIILATTAVINFKTLPNN